MTLQFELKEKPWNRRLEQIINFFGASTWVCSPTNHTQRVFHCVWQKRKIQIVFTVTCLGKIPSSKASSPQQEVVPYSQLFCSAGQVCRAASAQTTTPGPTVRHDIPPTPHHVAAMTASALRSPQVRHHSARASPYLRPHDPALWLGLVHFSSRTFPRTSQFKCMPQHWRAIIMPESYYHQICLVTMTPALQNSSLFLYSKSIFVFLFLNEKEENKTCFYPFYHIDSKLPTS